jgi:beta-lactamase regulating signal transducer with metallopeptidase domain
VAWFASWLWEGVVIVLLVSAMLRGLRRVDAATRYAIWWGTLLAIICWPAVTLARFIGQALLAVRVPAVPVLTAHSARHFVEVTVPSAPVWALRVAVGLWLASVIWKLSRLAVACWQLRRVKRSCAPVDADQIAHLPLWRAVSRRGRGALLCVSDKVGVACALGFRRPMIALPRQFVEQLAPRDLDQVALHEYAHLQRRDDWARLVQLAVDAVCGWHPAVRWISRQLTFEREVACDDWVVQRTRDPLGYARCLTTLAERTVAGRASTLSPAAWNSEAVVVRRVQRVLDARRHAAPSPSRWRLAIAVAVVALCAGEAGRVLALQDATDRIVASSPIGGTLSEAVTAEAFGSIAPLSHVTAAGTIATANAAVASGSLLASGAPAFGVAALAPGLDLSSIRPGPARADTRIAAAEIDSNSTELSDERPASDTPTVETAAHSSHPAAEEIFSPVPAVQHAFMPRATDEIGAGGTAPGSGFAQLDLSATVDDLVLDDDVDHEMAPPTLDQPAHSAGVTHVRASRPRTRGTGFFARVGRSIAHILGTRTRSPGLGTAESPRRRRASRALPIEWPLA